MIFLERVVCPDLGKNSRELRCVFFSKIETSRNLKNGNGRCSPATNPNTQEKKRKPSPADQNNRNIVFISLFSP